MLDNGLDAKLKGQAGVTLLHVAASCNKLLVAKMLLQAGADPTARNDLNLTPKDVAKDPAMVDLLRVCIWGGVGVFVDFVWAFAGACQRLPSTLHVVLRDTIDLDVNQWLL